MPMIIAAWGVSTQFFDSTRDGDFQSANVRAWVWDSRPRLSGSK